MSVDASYFDREYFRLTEAKGRYLAYLVGRLRRAGVVDGRVLDVGSGFGFFLDALAADGHAPVGLELSPFAAGVARRRGLAPTVVGTAEARLPFGDGRFDAVTLFDVIEHIEDHEGALRECARVLRPGGRVVVTTLNRWSVARLLLGRRWSWYRDPTHVHMFSVGDLRTALRAAGFGVVHGGTLFNFCSVGDSTPFLKPLRAVGRVVEVPAFGDSLLLVGERPAIG